MSGIPEKDKSKMIAMLKRGTSNEVVQKHFSFRYTRQQVAAIKAWITMGKY